MTEKTWGAQEKINKVDNIPMVDNIKMEGKYSTKGVSSRQRCLLEGSAGPIWRPK